MFKNSQVLEINICPKLIGLILAAAVIGTVSASPAFTQPQQGANLDSNADIKAKTQIYLSQAQTFFDQGNYDK